MTPAHAYDELIKHLRETATWQSIAHLLDWDEHTYMPAQGTSLRADQAALLARLIHERSTAPIVGELLSIIEASPLVAHEHSDAAVNVRWVRRDYQRNTRLPASLVEEQTRTAVLANQAWVEARKKSDFKTFAPWLSKTLELKRREAECVGHRGHIYNALLDPYEADETVEQLNAVFAALRQPLVELVGKIQHSGKKAPVHLLRRKFPVDIQAKVGREAAQAVGFDFNAGRLDISVHPFCSDIGPGDTRMTTRYDENEFSGAYFGVLHETGHALYDQGYPREHFGTPRGWHVSLGIHESQSRMWENLVGRSMAFWRHFFPKVKAAFADSLRDVTMDQWAFAINHVEPSLIRTESDEVTYNLHILLRFELEQALLGGDLAVDDLPGVWNERMRKYLGIVPPDDAKGCLQDIHWSLGSIGYFPTYTLGNLYAAQFFEAARGELGDLDAMFARGEFAPLLSWLRQHIHSQGRRYAARPLVKHVTGHELSARPLLDHLKRKAAQFYGV